jgi:membrane associated rhomboid family serine protease
MLVIPIAQENSVVRRTPWVTGTLVGLNVLVLVVLALAGDGRAAVRSRLSDFLRYLADRPYLAPPGDLAGRLGPSFERDLEDARQEWEDAGGAVAPEQIEEEQRRLDDLGRDVMAALRRQPAQRLGFIPAEARALAVLTSMFVHAGWMHLLGNMLFLFLTGPFVEDLFGRPVFTGLYLLAGAAAVLAHAAQDPASVVPLVGASGAVAGVMGAFLVRLARARIQFLVLPVPVLWMLRFKLFLPAFVVLPLWLVQQVVYAQLTPDAPVAFRAHVGGFVFGAALALVIRLTDLETRWINPGIEQETTLRQDPGVEKALEARLAGDLRVARRELRAVLLRTPDHLDALRESYELALAEGSAAEGGAALARLLELYQRTGETALAHDLAYDPRWRELGALPARAHLALAGFLERAGDAREALDHYEKVVEAGPSEPPALRALVRRGALLQRGGDAKRARLAYEEARAHPACVGAWPAIVARGLAEVEGAGRARLSRADQSPGPLQS